MKSDELLGAEIMLFKNISETETKHKQSSKIDGILNFLAPMG